MTRKTPEFLEGKTIRSVTIDRHAMLIFRDSKGNKLFQCFHDKIFDGQGNRFDTNDTPDEAES